MRTLSTLFRTFFLLSAFLSITVIQTANAQKQWVNIPGPWTGTVSDFIVEPVSGTLFASTTEGPRFRSTDHGESWSILDIDAIKPYSMCCADGKVWVGTIDGKVFRSDDMGDSWNLEYQGKNHKDTIILIGVQDGRLYSFKLGFGFYESDTKHNQFRWLFNPGRPFFTFDYQSTLAATRNGRIWLLPLHQEFDLGRSGWEAEDFSKVVAHDSILYVQINDDVYFTLNKGKNYTGPVIENVYSTQWWVLDGVLFTYKSGSTGTLKRSIDKGLSWKDVTVPSMYIQTMAAVNHTLYAGTYSGIYRSLDSGMTWRQVGGIQDKVDNLVFRGDTLIASTSNLFRKKESEAGWERIDFHPLNRSDDEIGLFPSGPDTLLAVEDDYSSNNTLRQENYTGLLHYSVDRGSTWSTFDTARTVYGKIVFHNGLYYMVHSTKMFKAEHFWGPWAEIPWERFDSTTCGVLSTPIATAGKYIYTRVLEYPNAHSRFPMMWPLYRSSDGGEKWERVDTNASMNWFRPYGEVIQGMDRLVYRLDTNVIRVYDPENMTGATVRFISESQRIACYTAAGDKVFIAAEYLYDDDTASIANPALNAGVFFSEDSGQTWVDANSGLNIKPLRQTSDFLWRLTDTDSTLFLRSEEGIYYYGEPNRGNRYRLTVESGLGSGEYYAGETVHVFSRELSNNEIFTHWTMPEGDQYLYRIKRWKEWHTTFTMPAADVTLKANFRVLNIPPTKVDTVSFEASPYPSIVRSIIPDSACALLCLFNDHNQTEESWIVDVEKTQFVRDALSYGFGVLLLQSQEVANGDLNGDNVIGWQLNLPISENNDLLALGEALTRLYPTNSPRFLVGIGRGGEFASIATSLLNYHGSALYASAGYDGNLNWYSRPTAFVLSVAEDAGLRNRALTAQDALWQNGIASELLIHQPSPLYPERFARINGIDLFTSITLFNEIQSGNFLNEQGFVQYAPSVVTQTMLDSPTSYPIFNAITPERQYQVLLQLKSAYAEQEFISDFDKTVLDFLKDYVSLSSVGTGHRNWENVKSPYALQIENRGDLQEIYFTLPEHVSVNLTVFDITGRAVENTFSGVLESGHHRVLSQSELTSGTYILSLVVDGKSVESKIVFITK